MAIVLRSFNIENAAEHKFVKDNMDKKQLLATIQSNVGSRLVYDAEIIDVKKHGVAFMVLVDTDTENMDEFREKRLPIVHKVIDFLEKTFRPK